MENGAQLAQNWTLTGAVWGGLFMFGVAYAGFVHWLGARKEGYVWLLVVIGVAATLLGGWLIDATPLGMFVCFAFSGAPMAAGSIYAHIVKRETDAANREAALKRVFAEIAEDE